MDPLPQTDEPRDLDFSPPASLTLPLWRSLLANLLDRLAPEKLPPLQLTSRPVNVGMLVGDMVDLPWYRTVFTNLGDVISPEVLPPLELESRPVDVGELIADRLRHSWWSSLLGQLRDAVSPDRVPLLRLTSKPFNPPGMSGRLQVPSWSALLGTPKVFLPDAPKAASLSRTAAAVASAPAKPIPVDPEVLRLERQLKRDLMRARLREAFWIGLLAAEAVVLFFGYVGMK